MCHVSMIHPALHCRRLDRLTGKRSWPEAGPISVPMPDGLILQDVRGPVGRPEQGSWSGGAGTSSIHGKVRSQALSLLYLFMNFCSSGQPQMTAAPMIAATIASQISRLTPPLAISTKFFNQRQRFLRLSCLSSLAN